jgi:hypothetical protein
VVGKGGGGGTVGGGEAQYGENARCSATDDYYGLLKCQKELNSAWSASGQRWTPEVERIDQKKRAVESALALVPGPIKESEARERAHLQDKLDQAKTEAERQKAMKAICSWEVSWINRRLNDPDIKALSDEKRKRSDLVGRRDALKGDCYGALEREYSKQEETTKQVSVWKESGLTDAQVDMALGAAHDDRQVILQAINNLEGQPKQQYAVARAAKTLMDQYWRSSEERAASAAIYSQVETKVASLKGKVPGYQKLDERIQADIARRMK